MAENGERPPFPISQQKVSRRGLLGAAAGLSAGALLASCSVQQRKEETPKLGATAEEIIKQRQLTPEDVTAALMTCVPSGKYDEFLTFSSTGHVGRVLVHGLPSMRLLKVIAVFSPEPWQGYGYGGYTTEVLEGSYFQDKPILWGDTHHPALSETNGEYDGEFLFINDKANGRIAVIDLRDFETEQIVKNPLLVNEHGGCFVTPNTEYVLETDQYSVPLGGVYAPITEYKEKYRGVLTFWKFDRQKGRIIPEESFAIETPPYWRGLADAGRGHRRAGLSRTRSIPSSLFLVCSRVDRRWRSPRPSAIWTISMSSIGRRPKNSSRRANMRQSTASRSSAWMSQQSKVSSS